VFDLERIFKDTFSKAKFKLQFWFIGISSQIKSLAATTTSSEDGSEELTKAFYIFSFAMFISLLFLAPDKIPQALTLTQAETGIFEKTQEIIKKLLPNLG